MRIIYVCDIDGTIADDRERKLRAGPEPSRENKPEYRAWLARIQSEEALEGDRPIHETRTLLCALQGHGKVFYLTAREEKFREVTNSWLKRHGFPPGPLLMRPNNSWASTADLKRARLRKIRGSNKCTLVAIDDDGSGDCTQMYAELGITHLRVHLPRLSGAAGGEEE